MKAVDFVVEESDRPNANPDQREAFLNELVSGDRDDDLVRKYRDSFIYRWAENTAEKPIGYLVLVAASRLDAAMLLIRTEELKRRLPVQGPPSI